MQCGAIDVLHVLLAALWFTTFSALSAETNSDALREFRGQVVCLPEEMNRLFKSELPTKHDHIYGLRANDGAYYTVLRTRLSEALFVDERLRTKELLFKARLLPKTQILDVSIIRSVKNGVVQDLYYYCGICDIESVSPEECTCCRGPVELIEKPLGHKKNGN